MTHTSNPAASRTIQRKAAIKKANALIADAVRHAASKWADGTLQPEDIAAIFATAEKADREAAR